MDKPLTLTPKTLLIAISSVVLFLLLVQIRGVLILLFVALLLALVLEPAVVKLQQKKVPRSLAVVLILVLLLGGLGTLLVVSIAPAINQTILFIERFPQLLSTLVGSVAIDNAIKNFGNTLVTQVAATSDSLIKVTIDIFNGLLTLLSVVFFSAYILVDFENLRALFIGAFRKTPQKELARKVLDDIQQRLGGWVRGQLLLMFLVGVGVFVGLSLLQLDYVLPLAIIAGILELVPIIGPILSLIPAAVVGFSVSPMIGLGVVGLFVLVQQLEGNLIVPKVMQKSVGFNPLITMIVLLIGGKLMGLVGVLLAIPVTLIIKIIATNILDSTHSS